MARRKRHHVRSRSNPIEPVYLWGGLAVVAAIGGYYLYRAYMQPSTASSSAASNIISSAGNTISSALNQSSGALSSALSNLLSPSGS